MAEMPGPELKEVLQEYAKNIKEYYRNETPPKTWYPMFYRKKLKDEVFAWVKENNDKYLENTPNKILQNRWYASEKGAITSMQFSPNGYHIIVGHASGGIEMRHGSTGTVLATLRNIQFPPKPVHALEYSQSEPNVCYAACLDGGVYRIEIPHIDTSVTDPPTYCIKADPMLDSLNMQFYGNYGISLHSTPLVAERSPALCLGLLANSTKMVIGYADTSVKIYDMETEKTTITYKVHKSRLQYIPKKLQRMHFGQVVALRCHPQKSNLFASGAWDQTLRIWDVRCSVGCVMTFEGVNICSDSIDLNREHCIAGSWQPTDGLTVWDLTARKLLNIIRVQNRRLDVDGEYIYACRYWHSTAYNRKGKYAIIGGSGTNCLEVINLHNRYITCSYPTTGTIIAVASHEERIAFGGTSSAFNIVSFYDPKYEQDKYNIGIEPDDELMRPGQGVITLFHDDETMFSSTEPSTTTSVAGEDPETQEEVKPDEGKPDEGKPDKGKQDEGKPDKGKPDKGKPDEGKPDKGKPDEGKTDKGKPDEGKPGKGKPDEGKPDKGKPDEGKPDEGKPDEGKPDKGKPDEGKPDEGKPDKGKPDEGKPDKGKTDEGKPNEGKADGVKDEKNKTH